MHKFLIVIVSIFVLSACSVFSPAPAGNTEVEDQVTPVTAEPSFPSEDNPNLVKTGVNIESAEILDLESYPLQFKLRLQGNLPSPCHRLDVSVQDPDTQHQIKVEVTAAVDSNKVCAQVIQPFDVTVDLGSYPSGRYTLWLNGEKVGDLQS
jgi:hypothetical protein